MSVDRLNLTTTLGGNTGKTAGDVRMGRIKALLLTRGKEFSEADRADSETFEAALEEAMLLSRESVNKVFPFSGFREADNNTGDPNVASLADGYEEVINEAVPKYTLKHTTGTAQTQSLVAFNGWNDTVYILDDKNIVWGVKTSSNGIKGFAVGHLYTTPPNFGGSGAINTSITKISFGSIDEFKSGLVALKLDFNVTDLTDIVDVELEEVAASSGYAFKIGGKTKYAGTDIYESYQDLLAVVGAWKAELPDGTAVDIASVVKDATNKGWTVTLDNTPTIAQGVKVKVNLVDPTALAALGTPVEGIEGITVKVTKPA
jgi:hypothetical protein